MNAISATTTEDSRKILQNPRIKLPYYLTAPKSSQC